jgi:uncharacterized protein YecE (DUF72 family)
VNKGKMGMPKRLQNYYLGCPVWANKDWVGTLFSADAKAKDYLRQYASVFNSVEGNSTFYALPKEETVRRWREETPEDFRFSFKFPRLITHILKLNNARKETARFLKLMEILGDRAGILFLQLPPSFDHKALPLLEKFLSDLSREFQYAVEVRHADFFKVGEGEASFDELMRLHNANRAIFDTSTLHAIESHDRAILEAQRKKPKMKETFTVTGKHPFLRFVGYKTVEPNLSRLTQLAETVAGWIENGQHPFVFMHSPDDFYAPQLCRKFHELLKERMRISNVGSLPSWPGEKSASEPEQLSLF